MFGTVGAVNTTVLNEPHHQNIFLCVHKLMDHLEDLETPVRVHDTLS